MQGAGKYGWVQLVGIRDSDGLRIKLGSARNLEDGRAHAQMMLASSSTFSRIYVRDSSGHRIVTVTKRRLGDRQLG